MELTLRLSHRSTLISSALNLLSRSLSPLSPSRTGRLFLVESHFLFVGKQQQPQDYNYSYNNYNNNYNNYNSSFLGISFSSRVLSQLY